MHLFATYFRSIFWGGKRCLKLEFYSNNRYNPAEGITDAYKRTTRFDLERFGRLMLNAWCKKISLISLPTGCSSYRSTIFWSWYRRSMWTIVSSCSNNSKFKVNLNKSTDHLFYAMFWRSHCAYDPQTWSMQNGGNEVNRIEIGGRNQINKIELLGGN